MDTEKEVEKKKNIAIDLLEFVIGYIFVLVFLTIMLYQPEAERLERMLFTSLIITTIIIGAWQHKG